MLTQKQVDALKCPKGKKLQRYLDSDRLYLEVTPTGKKHWRFRYKKPNGGESMLALGSLPHTTLLQARGKADKLRFQLTLGDDPAQLRLEEEQKAAETEANTFEVIAKEFMATLADKAPKTIEKANWVFGLLKPLHSTPVTKITAPKVHRLVEAIERTGRHETAHRVTQFASRVMNRAVVTGRADANPIVALRSELKAVKVVSHPAITEPKPFGALLRHIDNYQSAPVRHALQLLALLFPRPGELRFAQWSEFKLDGTEPAWSIPKERTKMRRPHVIPLPPPAVKILKAQRELTGTGQYVFQSGRGGHRPISDAALSAALHSLFYKDEHSPHGFRSSAATMLRDVLRFDSELVERALAHVKKSEVEGIYDRGSRLAERREMMDRWAQYLDELRATE